jgi:protein-S-isoprenylcysteine O-methyltransferase Ste14
MRGIHWLAAFILGFEMPVPIYWLILHSQVGFWRRHQRISYWIALIAAWGGGGGLLYHFRRALFDWRVPANSGAANWHLPAGLALIAVDIIIFGIVEFELGASRLVGHAEITGRGKLATHGLYTWVRHPRYMGMIAGIVGVCVLVNSRALWVVGLLWCVLAIVTIALEERELRSRFGASYRDYARRVPALIPFRLGSSQQRGTRP